MEIELGSLVGVYSRADTRAVLIVYAARALGVARETAEASEVRAFSPDGSAVGRDGVLVDRAGAARRPARLGRATTAQPHASAGFSPSTVVIGRPSGVSLAGRLRWIQRDTRAGSVEMMISS